MKAYLKSWLDWVEAGAPEGKPYRRSEGLCLGTYTYAPGAVYLMKRSALIAELRDAFERDGLDTGFPFGEENYWRRGRTDTQHTDPERLKWVWGQLK